MKYSAVILALALGVFAFPQDQATITSAPAASASETAAVQAKCLDACDPTDVTCRAQCLGVARPNVSQILETQKCAEACDQGDGSPQATEKFGQCLQDCYAKYFPSSQTLSNKPAGATDSANGGAEATGTGTQVTGSNSPSPTGSPAGASGTGAANSNTFQIAGAGLAGLVLAVFGL